MSRYIYKQVRQPDHPLADRRGTLTEHRKVLYDAIGGGPHPCHWCGLALSWRSHNQHKPKPDDLIVDHLNGDKLDNSRENLVPSCQACNVAKGFNPQRVGDAEVYKNHGGARLRGIQKVCPVCSAPFVTSPIYDNNCCSPTCAGLARRKTVCPRGHQKVWNEKLKRSRCATCQREGKRRQSVGD